MNIGFLESLRLSASKWDCFIFHDVDLIPEDERNIYSCPELPRHMSSAVSTFDYNYYRLEQPSLQFNKRVLKEGENKDKSFNLNQSSFMDTDI